MTGRHGCHSRPPFKDWHHAQNGYIPMSSDKAHTRQPLIVQIPHVMTRECQYTQLNPQDPGCAGCNHQSKP